MQHEHGGFEITCICSGSATRCCVIKLVGRSYGGSPQILQSGRSYFFQTIHICPAKS